MRYQAGLSFIEIIISLFILSLALLGLDAMTITALTETKIAYYFNAATQQVMNMYEQICANKSLPSFEEIEQWNRQNQALLPQGRGEVKDRFAYTHITVFWGKGDGSTCDRDRIGKSGCMQLSINH